MLIYVCMSVNGIIFIFTNDYKQTENKLKNKEKWYIQTYKWIKFYYTIAGLCYGMYIYIYTYLNTTTNNMCKSHKIHMYMSDLYKCICVFFFCLYILFWFFLAWHSSCTNVFMFVSMLKHFFARFFYKTIIKNFSNIRKIIIEKKQEIQLKRKKNK